ncbi:rod shape-determining protein MreD [Terrilactibacillus laevilacticus]|uniref:Rod shape-determining protein MreD n=1 Tax=Terrilactibacillus laevilacticus TaxID=1380157 RepID=A0ABW5PTC6_9BACI|nr:rod shape-determining protein MreD [Terrilactibacillus laevilacticus]
MKHLKLFLVLFLLLIIEGSVMPVFLPDFQWKPIQMVPVFVFIFILFISFFLSRNLSLLYAIVFGFLTDMVYTSILGVYAFCMGLTAYLFSYLARLFHLNLFIILILTLLGISVFQFEVYMIYSLIGVTNQSFTDFLKWRLPATLLLNGVFIILFYYPFQRLLLKIDKSSD